MSEEGRLLAIRAVERDIAALAATDEDVLAALRRRAQQRGLKPTVLARNLIREGLQRSSEPEPEPWDWPPQAGR